MPEKRKDDQKRRLWDKTFLIKSTTMLKAGEKDKTNRLSKRTDSVGGAPREKRKMRKGS